MFLAEHRVFLTIRIVNKVLVRSGSRGPGTPLIFKPNWAEKNFASGTFGDAELIIIYVSLSFLR